MPYTFEMSIENKRALCEGMFESIIRRLEKTHELVGSCNKDASAYLIPKGTADEISYYGKPIGSFRISDHWNWYSSEKRCTDLTIVQCESVDIPRAKSRLSSEPTKATKPRRAWQIAYYGTDGKYHCVFGERFNKKTMKWEWIDEINMDWLRMAEDVVYAKAS